jgi:acyl-CoA reductase-like NAD-dependent aldehyde dehydrogenase
MSETLTTISPVDGSVYVERPLASAEEVGWAMEEARDAQRQWRAVPLAERADICNRFIEAILVMGREIALEITWQMGRPISQAPGELRGFEERARYMVAAAEGALADVDVGERPGFTRFIRREPLGVALVVAPWNYPYLTSVNSVVPAIMAGNAVVLKASHQTPLTAERYDKAFKAASLPAGVFQVLHMSHANTERAIRHPNVDYVAFTGSVDGGHAVQRAAAERFIGTSLELGGKDPAYVRPDAPLAYAIENLVDGAFFNAGQSCCAIERIYAHADVYDDFVAGFRALVQTYKLGKPTAPETNLGPMVRTNAADLVRGQVAAAVAAGAIPLIDASLFPAAADGTPYLAPQVLVDVDHEMAIMKDETFGPAIGIMKVSSDEDAVELMNDSPFGLTASIWTSDTDAAIRLGDRIDTGTWFMNRCDYLDPALAWTGVKDSGRGCSLSVVGYEHLTRPKSFHLQTGL